MIYLLDTDICVYFLNGNASVVDRVDSINDEDLAISIISLAELQFGAYNSQRVQCNLERIEFLSTTVAIMPLTPVVTELYAKYKATLRRSGNPISDFDIMIGATAAANNLVLVTNNEQHYSRLAEIKIENWVK